ncbi:MAG TPA: thioredoxin [Chitinophagales bacterium]|nr:thioredoxin [Chitinophagales bacterium]
MKFDDIIQSNETVLVDFFATWCGPCKMVPPILADVKQRLGDQVKIIKIDVDKNPQVSQRFQIQSIPTIMIFKKGEMVWRKSGVVPAHELEKLLK